MLRLSALLAFSAVAVFAQTPTISSVVNAESYGTQLCPGVVATIFGANFGTSATNISVSVGTNPAFVGGTVTATQFSVIIPFASSAGATTLTVTVGGVASAPFNITISAVAPYLDTQNASGSGLAAVYDVTAGTTLVTAANPAHAGDAVVAYAVGLGPTTPATPDTANGLAPATAKTAAATTVTVGGVAATVAFAGLTQGSGEGVYQVNFTVPTGVQGTVPLVIAVDGVTSTSLAVNSATVTMAVVSSAATPTITGVQNASSFGTTLCPGLEAIIYGTGFGATAANVSFSVGGKPGYVFPNNVSGNQILVQLPFEASTGATTITVTVSGVASAPFNITLNATAPAFNIQVRPAPQPTRPAPDWPKSRRTVPTRSRRSRRPPTPETLCMLTRSVWDPPLHPAQPAH